MDRGRAWIVGGIAVGALVVSCSKGGDDAPPPSPVHPVDITAVGKLQDQFPPGFTVQRLPRSVLTKDKLDQMNGGMDAATFDPPECAESIMGRIPKMVGATMEMINGVTTEAVAPGLPLPKMINVVATESPTPVSLESFYKEGCENSTMVIPDKVEGTVETIETPDIDGLKVHGTRSVIKPLTSGPGVSFEQVMYEIDLDDHHGLKVQAVGYSDVSALQALLVKAVKAVRG